MAGKTAEDKED